MSLTLTAKETALVLIDLEHGIVSRDTAPHETKDVVSRCAALAEKVREAGGTVVYVHVLLNAVPARNADKPMPRPSTPPPPEASELVPEAGYQAGTDVLVTKRQWDAFYGTDLGETLRLKGIKTVIMGGLMTNFGVESTARSAQALGYDLVFAEDAMSSMTKDMHAFSVEKLFPIMGKVRSASEIGSALE